MMNDYLQYPGYQPSMDYSGGMVAYNPQVPQATPNSMYGNVSNGLYAGAGATTAMPWVSGGLAAAGLLTQLYGNYKARETASENFQAQKREFERQKALEADAIRRQEAQQALQNAFEGGTYAQNKDQSLLSQYLPYYRSIGV